MRDSKSWVMTLQHIAAAEELVLVGIQVFRRNVDAGRLPVGGDSACGPAFWRVA